MQFQKPCQSGQREILQSWGSREEDGQLISQKREKISERLGCYTETNSIKLNRNTYITFLWGYNCTNVGWQEYVVFIGWHVYFPHYVLRPWKAEMVYFFIFYFWACQSVWNIVHSWQKNCSIWNILEREDQHAQKPGGGNEACSETCR